MIECPECGKHMGDTPEEVAAHVVRNPKHYDLQRNLNGVTNEEFFAYMTNTDPEFYWNRYRRKLET